MKKDTDIFLVNGYSEIINLDNIKFIISKFHYAKTFCLQIVWFRSKYNGSDLIADNVFL